MNDNGYQRLSDEQYERLEEKIVKLLNNRLYTIQFMIFVTFVVHISEIVYKIYEI